MVPGGYLVGTWWVPDGYLVGTWWVPGGYLVGVGWSTLAFYAPFALWKVYW